ncbi:MAG TPA: hypothetical protein VF039_10665 [Longimicrobiales bacterium]
MTRILCIDGGGIRGIVPAVVLDALEQRTGRAISDCFDLIAGPEPAAARPGGDRIQTELEDAAPELGDARKASIARLKRLGHDVVRANAHHLEAVARRVH